jgi:hypothetical protein
MEMENAANSPHFRKRRELPVVEKKRLQKRGRSSWGDCPAVLTCNETVKLVDYISRVRRYERPDEGGSENGVIFKQLPLNLVERMVPRLADSGVLTDRPMFEGVRKFGSPCFRLLHR